MPVDAHIHFANLFERDPGFPGRFAASGIRACAASHSPEEFAWTEALRRRGLPCRLSYGLHPQAPDMAHAELLGELARSGRIEVVGEAGFDFFGDRPEYTRSPENLALQRRAFEFQLALALETGLPLLIHIRKAVDLMFEYSRELAKLPALIFHSWPGTAGEGEALLGRGLRAYFSFGAIVANGQKKALESLRVLPAETLLSETDAPWQPPRGGGFCRFEDLGPIVEAMAACRGLPVPELEALIDANWDGIFGKGA